MQHSLHNASVGAELLEAVAAGSTGSSLPSKSWLCLVGISVIGVICNCSIFWKSKYRRKSHSSPAKLSLSLLCVMAGADTACLVALLFILSLRYLGIESQLFLSVACKLNIFTIHAASSFSLYCWLVLSIVRYIAVFSPYTHLRIHREPHLAVVALAVFSGILESWVLYDVEYFPALKACESKRDEESNRRIQIAEIVASYFIPLAIITACDIKVLFFRTSTKWRAAVGQSNVWQRFKASSKERGNNEAAVPLPILVTSENCTPDRESVDSQDFCRTAPLSSSGNGIAGDSPDDRRRTLRRYETLDDRIPSRSPLQSQLTVDKGDEEQQLRPEKKNRSKRRAAQLRVLRRALLISVLDLGMNLPNYVLRLYLNLVNFDVPDSHMEVIVVVETVSQIMYFAQFALNAFYLVCLVYDSPKGNRKQPVTPHRYSTAPSPVLAARQIPART